MSAATVTMLNSRDFRVVADVIYCLSGSEFPVERHDQIASVCRRMTWATTADFWRMRTALRDALRASAWTVTDATTEQSAAIDRGFAQVFGVAAGPDDASVDFVFAMDGAAPSGPLLDQKMNL